MLFMYWTSSSAANPASASAWKRLYPEFRLFTDEDVMPLLPKDFVTIYKSIRLPSAKSDIARLFLLREHGGLYIDAHVGPTSPSQLLETVERLSRFNLILFGKGWVLKDEEDFDLMNGVMAARRHAPELDIVIEEVVGNIKSQWEKERNSPTYHPYNLHVLTGTYVLVQTLFDLTTPPKIRSEMSNSILVHFMKDNVQSGFSLSAFNGYRKTGLHWSERQTNERLFAERIADIESDIASSNIAVTPEVIRSLHKDSPVKRIGSVKTFVRRLLIMARAKLNEKS